MSVSMTKPLIYSSSLPPRSYRLVHQRTRFEFDQRRKLPQKPPIPSKVICALHRDDAFHDRGYNGKLVDEDMIILRKRIHEIKTAEGSHDDVATSDWMEWEKKYYADNYDSDVCEAVGSLQSQLMNTRPSLALVMLAVVSLSVPISMAVVLLRLMDMAKDVGFNFF